MTVTCESLKGSIEALASGELEATREARAHLESCVDCAAALSLARRIERLLAAQDVSAAPARFTESVITGLRRERWRSEQHLDRWFNALIAVSAALILAGVWLFMNVSGMAAVNGQSARLLARGVELAIVEIAPALPTYAGGTALLMIALGVWLWAERRMLL
jgi:hypothetical protein